MREFPVEFVATQVPSVLPEGTVVPPLSYLVGLLVAAAIVGYGFLARRPAVTGTHVISLGPWIATGAAGHVLHVLGALPPVADPLGGTPAVYLATGVVAGCVWLVATTVFSPARVPAAIGSIGGVAFVTLLAWVLVVGTRRGGLELLWPAVGLVVSVAITILAWRGLERLRPEAAAATGSVGRFALFGHVIDAISTTVGVDVLGFGERTPLSRVILEFSASLPTAEILGAGWLFVLVKVVIVGWIVVLFAEYVETDPVEGRLLLGFIAAVGLGPGVHNLLLFAATGGI
ncbi:MAG: DUF63 family protein [Halobacteriota archaeon]